MTNRSLPTVTSQIPQDLRNFLNRVREIVGSELASGADLERSRQLLNGELNRILAQQHADLVNLESVVNTVAESLGPNRPCGATVAPSQPTGTQAWGAFEAIALTWDTPEYCGHQSTEVWVAEADDFELAELAGEVAYATTFTHALAANQTRWYWLRFVNDEGTEGPFTTESVTATTAIDLEAVLLALTGQITESQLYQDLAARIDLIDGPADLLGSVAAQFAQEGLDRADAIAAEAAARAAAISAAFDQAQSDIDAADARITTVRGEINDTIALIDADVTAADARITTVKSELEGLIDAAEADILAADARITTVKGELETDLAGAQVSLNARIDNVNAAIADIEATADFSSASDYALHALVRYDGKLYRAIQAMTAPSPLPTDLAYWEKVGDYASFADGLQANSSAIAAINTVTAGSDSANARALAAVTATVTDPTTGLASRAAVTDLDEAVADIYGAEASRFTSLSASFDYDANLADINNLGAQVLHRAEVSARADSVTRTEASIYGASVEQFTQLSAKFGNVDGEITELNTITLDSGSALARTTASLQATIEDPATGLGSKASASEMTTAIANVYGASVESFSNINAKFGLLDGEITGVEADITDLNTVEVDSDSALARATATIKAAVEDPTTGLSSKASTSEVTTAVADVYGASVTEFTNIQAKFNNVDALGTQNSAAITAINDVGSDSTSAIARTAASLKAAVENPTTGLASKASSGELTTAVADIYGASVESFSNINAKFGLLDAEITGVEADITDLNDVTVTSDSALARTAATLNAVVNDPTTGLGSRASVTDLADAKSDIFGAEAGRFSGLESTFSYDAAQREITNLGLDVFSKAEASARIDSYERTKADIFGASAESFSGLAVEFQGIVDANAGISQLNNVSVDSESALARSVALLDVAISDPLTGLSSKAGSEEMTTAFADVYGASAESFTGLSAQFQDIIDAKSGITQLNTVTVDSDSALASSVATMQTEFYDPVTGNRSVATITEVNNAKSDVFGASADSFTGLSAEFQAITDAAADITELNTISVDSDSALASTVAGMRAEMYDPVSGTLSLATKTDITDLESTIYGASASSFTGLSAQFQDITDAKSDITQLNTISTSSGSALARKVANIESAVDDLESGTAGGASIAYVDATAADIYGASASSFTGLTATFSNLDNDIDAKATITDVNEVLANGNSTTALSVKQLAAGVVDGNQTLIDVTAKADELGGQYTVKIDSNNRVAGFGLATEEVAPNFSTSKFIVTADEFAIGDSNYPDLMPFIVNNSTVVVDGETIAEQGVYINGAKIMGGSIDGVTIKNSTITDSHLISVTAGKITSGDIAVGNTIESASYSTGNYGWRIDGNGNATFNGGTFNNITVKDAAGNIILSSGKVLASKVDGLGTLATRSTVSSTYISDLEASKLTTGTLNVTTELKSANYVANSTGWLIDGNGNVVFNQGTFRGITVRDSTGAIILSAGRVQTSGIDGLGALATRGTVAATHIDDSAVSESKLGTGAVSTTKIANAAITEAKIGSLAVTGAKIANAAITEAKIGSLAVTGAKIANAAITEAKITNAAVSTLKIDGNAVTVPLDTISYSTISGTGVNNWHEVISLDVENTATTTMETLILFTARMGYLAGDKDGRFRLRWTYTSTTGGTFTLKDFGLTTVINDYVTLAFTAGVVAGSIRTFTIEWWGEDGDVRVESGSVLLALGTKR